MSFSLSINGHGASGEDAKRIFSQAVREFRQAQEGVVGASLNGSVGGSDANGTSFGTLSVSDVDNEPSEASEGVEPEGDEE